MIKNVKTFASDSAISNNLDNVRQNNSIRKHSFSDAGDEIFLENASENVAKCNFVNTADAIGSMNKIDNSDIEDNRQNGVPLIASFFQFTCRSAA